MKKHDTVFQRDRQQPVCGKRMGEELGDEVVSVNERLKNKNREALRSQTPFVVVSPVYAWRLPRVVEGFILETAFEGNADVYFVLTCGGDVGLAGKYAKKLCAKKDLRTMGLWGYGCRRTISPCTRRPARRRHGR